MQQQQLRGKVEREGWAGWAKESKDQEAVLGNKITATVIHNIQVPSKSALMH